MNPTFKGVWSETKASVKFVSAGVLFASFLMLIALPSQVSAAAYTAGGGTASGSNAVAIGNSSNAAGSGSVAIGNSTSASSTSSVALGGGSKALSSMSVALAGGTVTADNGWGFAATGGTVQGYNSVAIGRETYATSRNALAIGDYTTADFCGIALGESAKATGFSHAIAIGTDSKSTESYTVALGYNSEAAAESSVAIGNGAAVGAKQSVAIGTGSFAVDQNVVSVGHKTGDKVGTYTWSTDYYRRIVNVANGVNDHDAVTVAQLNAAVSGSSYSLPAATSSVLGGVKTGSNITNSSGTISLTKANVVAALGYTPPTTDTNTTYSAATSSALGLVKIGSNITNSSGTISLTKANVTAALGYTPPTTDTNTTYSNMKAATASAAGTAGLVPAPAAGKQTAFLRGDGTWVVPTDTNTTYSAATSSALGLVKVGSNITNSSGTISLTKANVTAALGYTPPTTNTTYSNMGAATADAAGAAGLVPAPAKGAQNYVLHGDGTWKADANTTYSAMSASEATTGTATTARTITAKVLTDFVGEKVTAAKNGTITGLSISGKTITYTKGDGTTGTLTTQDNNTTYSAMGADELLTGTATTGRTMTAKVLGDYVKGRTDDKLTGLSVSGKTITFTKGDGTSGTITTQDTTYSALALDDANTGTATAARTISAKVLSDFVKGKVDTESSARSGADTALSNRIGSLSADGHYIRKAATNDISANLLALDNALYSNNSNIAGFSSDITRNKNNIAQLNTSVSSALSSVATNSELVNTLDSIKADTNLNNLTAAGKRVIAAAAANAVQEYMAAQQNNVPMVPMAVANGSNTLNVTDAGNGSLHVGEGSYVNGTSSIAIGVGNQVNANNSGAFGDPSIIDADESYVLGNDDRITSNAKGSFLVGNDSKADAEGSLIFGSNVEGNGKNGISIGNNSKVTAENSIALGSSSVADTENVVSVGNSSFKRKIVNVMDGDVAEGSTDVVTGGQLYTINQLVQQNVESIQGKADLDGSNIDVDVWTQKLGIGTVEDGNTNLVTGGAVFDALSELKNDSLVQSDGDTITIGRHDSSSEINVSNAIGSPRIIRGVYTDANDVTSAANVGYVNAVSDAVLRSVNNGLSKVNRKVDKVGANAAALASLTPATFDGDEKWSLAASVGHYEGQTSGAVGAFYRPAENVLLNVRGAFCDGENMFGGGVAVSLNKGDVPGVTKRKLAEAVNKHVQIINAQADKIQSLEHRDAEREEELAALKQQVAMLTEKLGSIEGSIK